MDVSVERDEGKVAVVRAVVAGVETYTTGLVIWVSVPENRCDFV
jgi:hypothetical protein